MDFLRLNSADFEEFLFDMQGIKEVFEKRGERFEYKLNELQSKIGTFDLKGVRKGNVYLSHFYSFFRQNILSQSNTGIENISLYFVKKGNAVYHWDKKTKKEVLIPSFSHNVWFMNEEYNEKGFYLKNKEQEVTSLHLPIAYFKQWVNLYPEVFEKAFLRYEKGENFYLNNAYQQTTSQQYTILDQIANSHLMGTGSDAYVDAKVLELLTLCFSQPYREQAPFKEYDKIQEAALILTSDIHNPPSIRTLALRVGVNEKKLKQGFKIVFNNTVYGYLFDYKMQLAKNYLQDTKKPIAEIALQCGYNYPSHFCTAFKRKFGVSPNESRKKTPKDR